MYVGAIFLPLLGACLAGFLGRWLGDKASQWVTVLCMVLAAACGIGAFIEVALGGAPGVVPIFSFLDVGEFEAEWALRYDTLSAVMVAMVTFIILWSFGIPQVTEVVTTFLGKIGHFIGWDTMDDKIGRLIGWCGTFAHYQSFIKGIVNPVDVVYAVAMMAFFLILNNFAVEWRRL